MAGVILWLTTPLLSVFLDGPEIPSTPSPPIFLVTQVAPGVYSSSFDGSLPSCATDAYYGAYGRPLQHVYRLDDDCFSKTLASFKVNVEDVGLLFEPDSSHVNKTLFWLQGAGVGGALRNGSSFEEDMMLLSDNVSNYLTSTRSHALASNQRQLDPLSPAEYTDTNKELVFKFEYYSANGAIVAVDENIIPQFDALLPPYVVSIALPEKPMPFTPVPKEATERVKEVLKKLRFNPDIASILSTLSVDSMRLNIRHLSGEDTDASGARLLSRHSFSQGAKDAADWIEHQLALTGARCRQESFLLGYAPNVICRFPGPRSLEDGDSTRKNESLVLFSAHYDSRGSFGSTRAPGANDDGSGVLSILAIARAIHDNGIRFTKHAVELVAFAGEEQGLRGSKAYASHLREQGVDIALMVQADMLAYHSPGEPLQLGLPDLIGLPEAAQLVANVSKIYSPELTIGVTPACCSDHQSFHLQGFPSTQVYERAGPIVDPMYHNSGDLSDRRGYDLQQVRSIAKVTFATLLEVAGFTWDADRDRL